MPENIDRKKDDSKYAWIYKTIENFSTLMFNDFFNVNLIQKNSSYSKVIAEIILFFSWELDVCMNAAKQSKETRRSCLSVIVALLSHRLEINNNDLIGKILLKRLLEYSEIENSPNQKNLGIFLLLVSFLKDNLQYAYKNNDFYYCDGVRPLLSLDYFEDLKFGQLIKLYHVRTRICFDLIFKDSTDIALLSEKEFETRMNEALEKDKQAQGILLKYFDENM